MGCPEWNHAKVKAGRSRTRNQAKRRVGHCRLWATKYGQELCALMITATGIAASGLLDLGASTLFAHASMAGRLGITSTLGGLHPVVTILLSRFVLDERPGNVQTIGVVLAIAGTVLATM